MSLYSSIYVMEWAQRVLRSWLAHWGALQEAKKMSGFSLQTSPLSWHAAFLLYANAGWWCSLGTDEATEPLAEYQDAVCVCTANAQQNRYSSIGCILRQSHGKCNFWLSPPRHACWGVCIPSLLCMHVQQPANRFSHIFYVASVWHKWK